MVESGESQIDTERGETEDMNRRKNKKQWLEINEETM